MVKRLTVGLLLALGLALGSLAFFGGHASAYGTSPGSSTTDPCLVGNGTTGTTNPTCLGSTQPASGTAAATEASSASTSPASSSGSLAFTGTDVVGTVIVGAGLIGGGIIIVRLSRRRTTH